MVSDTPSNVGGYSRSKDSRVRSISIADIRTRHGSATACCGASSHARMRCLRIPPNLRYDCGRSQARTSCVSSRLSHALCELLTSWIEGFEQSTFVPLRSCSVGISLQCDFHHIVPVAPTVIRQQLGSTGDTVFSSMSSVHRRTPQTSGGRTVMVPCLCGKQRCIVTVYASRLTSTTPAASNTGSSCLGQLLHT